MVPGAWSEMSYDWLPGVDLRKSSIRPSMQLGEIVEGSEKSKQSQLSTPKQSASKRINKFQKQLSNDCSLDFNMAAYLNKKPRNRTSESPDLGYQNNSYYLSEQVIRTPIKAKPSQYQIHLPQITPSNFTHRSGSLGLTPMNSTDRRLTTSVMFDSQEKIDSQNIDSQRESSGTEPYQSPPLMTAGIFTRSQSDVGQPFKNQFGNGLLNLITKAKKEFSPDSKQDSESIERSHRCIDQKNQQIMQVWSKTKNPTVLSTRYRKKKMSAFGKSCI